MSDTAKGSEDKTIHVLSIDGGGVRGIIPAEILAYITDQTKLPVHEMFDLVAGTSTGGIIALGLGTKCKDGNGPYTPRELSDLYLDNGSEIFPTPMFPTLKQVFGPKYSERPLEIVLNNYFQRTMLASALTPLLIASYDLISQLPFFFKSHRIAADPSYDVMVRDIARATSAAPTYFPPFQTKITVDGRIQELCLVDGGVFANNPAMAAYAEARMLYRDVAEPNFLIVSVGTGDRKDQLNCKSANGWGLLKWAKLLVPIFMDSVSEAVDYELQWIAPEAFRRFQCEGLTLESSQMDNASAGNLKDLKQEALVYIDKHKNDLDALCDQLEKGRGGQISGTGLAARSNAVHGQ